jgi:hypothetical protein
VRPSLTPCNSQSYAAGDFRADTHALESKGPETVSGVTASGITVPGPAHAPYLVAGVSLKWSRDWTHVSACPVFAVMRDPTRPVWVDDGTFSTARAGSIRESEMLSRAVDWLFEHTSEALNAFTSKLPMSP